jgi:SpoVK/Ycf46/Vps4 family AAA+-type ATPase
MLHGAAILAHYLGRMPTAADVTLDGPDGAAWVRATAGQAGALLEAVCREAAMAALRDTLAAQGDPTTARVHAIHLHHALAVLGLGPRPAPS